MSKQQEELVSLTKRRNKLMAELREVWKQIRKLKGVKERPKEGQRIVAKLRACGYTKNCGEVKGVYQGPEIIYGNGRQEARLDIGRGKFYLWRRVVSWKPAKKK